MKNILFHNPQCSKSRGALQILQEKGIDIEVVEYLKTPPTVEEIKEICSKLNISPQELIRTKEPLFKELGLSLNTACSEAEWFQVLAKHPKLMERPILCYNDKAVIGRPPEKILNIL